MAIDNKVDQFSENINKAIEIHVQNAITGLEFNKTEQAEIVDVSNAAAGDYIVSNGSARYHAFANEANYTLGTKVNVLIPNNDYGQQKLILGKAKRSTTQSLSYVSPLEGYEPKTKNIVEDKEKFIVPSWTITKTIENDVEKIEADESIKPDIFKIDDYLQEAAKITDEEREAGKRVEIPLDETFLMIPEIYFDRKEPVEIIKKVTEKEESKTTTTITTDYAINKSDSNFISVYGASREGDETVPMKHGTNKLIYFSEDLSIKNSVNTEENNNINQNYKYMGLSAQFKTAFNDDIRVVSGDYGIDIVILYSKKNQDLNQSRLYFTRTYRMSATDMLGSIYDFSTGHIQEALFELETDQKEDVLIHRIAILLHQDGKFKYLFKNGSRETFPIIKYENEEGENRVYVSNIELRLGNQLDTRYKFDSVSIHTEDGAYYDSAQIDDKYIQKTIILDWTHTDPNTGLKTTFTRVPREVSNQVDDSVATITWFRDYHYSVSQYRTNIEATSDDYDALSLVLEEYKTFYEQNFAWITTWETEASKDEPSEGNNYWESFKDAQRDIYKNQYDENRDTDYTDADAYADAKVKAIEQEVRNMNGSLVRLINELKLKSGTHYYYDPVNKAIMLTKSGREAAERKINRDSKTIVSAMNADAQLAGDGWVAIGTKKENTMEIDFIPDRTVNTCKVKCVIQYGPVDSDGNYITSNPYYRVLESNELIFTNLTSVPDVSTWDVSAGLQFYFKDKSNGFYPLYDYTGALIDQQNANKTRTLEVDMRTTLFGESYINGNEIIVWRLPKNNSMLDFSANLVDDVDEKRTEGDEIVSITYGPHQVKELTSEEVNNLLGSHGIKYEEDFMYLKYEANDSNKTVENRDKDGNIQYEKGKEGEDKVDEEGYKLDEAGQRIPILKIVTARNYIKYKIKEIYKPYFYNNTVSCFLIKSNTDGFFTGSTEISFSNKGNNGTDYTLVLTLGETFTVDNLVTYDEVISDQVSELRRLIEKYSGDIATTEAAIEEIENKENPTAQEEEDLKDYKTQLEILKKKKFDYERTLELDKETVEEIEAESEKEAYDPEDLDEEYVEEDLATNEETTPSEGEGDDSSEEEDSEDDEEGEELPEETTFEDNSFKDLRTLPNIYVSNDWVKAGPPEEAITLGEEKFHRIIFEVHDADGLKIDLTDEQKNDIISSWVGALSKGYYAGVQNVKNLDFLCKLNIVKNGEDFINNFTDIAVRANPGITTEESNLVIEGEASPSSDEDLKTLEDFKYIVMQLQLNTSLFEDEEEDIIDFDSEDKAFSLSNVNLLTLLPLNFRVNKEDSVQGSNFLYYDDNGSLSKKYPFGYYLNNQSFEEQQGNISAVYNLVMQKLTEAREEKEKLISTLRDVYKSYMDAATAELPESVKEDIIEDGVPMETSLTEEQQILQEFEELLDSQLKNDYSWLFQDIKDPQINGDYWFRSDASKQDFINNINYFIENLDEAFDDDEDIKLFGQVFLSRPYANWLRYILHKDFRAEYTTDIDQDHLDEAVFRSKYNKKLVKKKLDAAKKKYQNNVSKKTKAINKAIKPLKTKLNKAESQLKKIDAQIKKYLEYYSLEKDGDTPYFTIQEDSFTVTNGQTEFTLTETPVLNYFCVSINDVLQTNTKKIQKYSISGTTLKLETTVKENDIVKCTYYNYNPIVIENSQWKRDYSVSVKPLEEILNAIEEQDKKIEDANENIKTLKTYWTAKKADKQVEAYSTTEEEETIISDVPGYDRKILKQDWFAIDDLTDLQEIQIKIARFFNDFDNSGDKPVFKLSSNLTTTEKKEKNGYIDKFNKLQKDKIKAQQKIIDKAKKAKKAQQKKLKNYVKGTIKPDTTNVQLKETDSVADWKAFIYKNVDTKELNEENIAKINKITTYYTDIEKKIKSSLSGNKDKKLRYEHLKNRYNAQIEKKNEDLKKWKDTYYYPSRENPIRFEPKRNDEYKDYRGVKNEETGEYSDYPNPSDPEIEGFEKKLYIDVLNDCYVIWNLNGVVPKTITSYTISIIMASADEFRKKLNEFKDKNYKVPDPEDTEKTKPADIIEYWNSFYQILVSAQRKLGWFDVSVGVYNGELDEPIYEDLREKYTLSADKQEYVREIARKVKDEEYTPSEEEAKIIAAYLKEAERLQAECKKALQYYPSIEKKHTLKAPSFYSDGLNTNIAILCYEETEDSEKGNLLYIMPLIIIRNTHDIASINKWNGQAVIDKDGNQIMSSLMAAGTKDKNNNFTGVIIGDIEPSGTQASYSSAKMNGIYGYHAGVQSFGIKTDGTSFLGKEGMGRIEFDGNKGTIQSGGYSVDDKMGTKIDLVTGDIDLYTRPPHWYEQYEDEDGNVELIQTDSYGDNLEDPDSKYAHIHIGGNSPDSSEQDSYFSISAPSTIKDLDNGDYANEENTPLIHIGQNEYFLQTADYINDPKADVYSGLRIDLTNGTFDSKGKFVLTAGEGSSITLGDPNHPEKGYFYVDSDGALTCDNVNIRSGKIQPTTTVNQLSSKYLKASSSNLQVSNTGSSNSFTSVKPTKINVVTGLTIANNEPSSSNYITIDFGTVTTSINLGTEEEPDERQISITIPPKYIKITEDEVWVFKK